MGLESLDTHKLVMVLIPAEYMAPEVLQCPHKVKPLENKNEGLLAYGSGVDAWAVGVMSFEILVRHPYR